MSQHEPTGWRARMRQALDEAESKASSMTEEELNARLGPATRTLFSAGERIEFGAARAAANTGRSLAVITAFITTGYLMGAYLGDRIAISPVLDLVLFAAITALAFAAASYARKKGSDVGYLAGFLATIAASAGSGGALAVIGVASGAAIGAGLAGWRVPLPPAPPSVHT